MKDREIKLKEDNKNLIDENDILEKEIIKLKAELKKMKNLQKIVDALRMNKKDQAKNYKTESLTLDYLRPRDFEDDRIKSGNTYVKAKRPSNNYAFKKTTRKDEDKNDEKAKNAAMALMRIRQAQENKRKKDE